MTTGIIGLRGTGQYNTDFRPTNYREVYTMLEPNGTAPLNALLAMGSSEEVDDPRFNTFTDELPDRVVTVNNVGGYNAIATAIQLAAGSTQDGYFIQGAIVVNTRTGEMMQLTADANTAADTIAVTRNIGGTAFTINDQDRLMVAGFAAAEGADAPSPVSFDATLVFNFTQIFRTSWSLTNTQKSTTFRNGDKEAEYGAKALKLHMSDIERAMFWGRRVELNGTSAQPTRYTGGLMSTLTTVLDGSTASVPGLITETDFDAFLVNTVFAFGSKEKVAFCGPTVINHLMRIAKDRWQPSQVDNTYGVSFTRYTTFAGDLVVHLHPQFRQMPNMANAAVLLDFPYLKYRYLKGRDTQLLQNRQGTSADRVLHEYLTECGLELLQNKVHTVIRNWNAVVPT